MDTFEKLIRSWWVLFPFTLFLPGFGFIYIGLKASNRKWIVEGVTYQLPIFLYFAASAIYPASIMIRYYLWLILLAALIALIRSIMLAIKLIDVYEKEDRPKITVSSSASGSGGSANTNAKKAKDSNWPACCACLVFIFIIFAIVSIL